MCKIFVTFLLLYVPGIGVLAAEPPIFKDENDKISYSIGYQIGGDFAKQGVALNTAALVQGVQDALGKKTPLLTREEMHAVLIELKKQLIAAENPAAGATAATPLTAEQIQEQARLSRTFLEENAKKDGVTVLPDGVQYRVIKAGSGRKPTLNDEVAINFRTTLIDGKELATTYKENVGTPKVYQVAKVLPGLQKVLPLMAEGAKWQVVLPPLTGAKERELLQSHQILIYDIELVAVTTSPKVTP